VKKATATNYRCFFSFFFIWSLWSSSLELKVNNEMVVFFNVDNYND
jgi:hypothetical protein